MPHGLIGATVAQEAVDPHYHCHVIASFVRVACIPVILSTAVTVHAVQPPPDPQELFDRAINNFFAANILEAAADFDTLIAHAPNLKPQLWQRGIVLYYAQRYDDCREQFESHRTVNPNDVENAVWHFLCVARSESPERARAALLPVGPDPRRPMQQIYGLFSGSQSADEVVAAARGRASAEFYAHLYLGLYAEALGNEDKAIAHISRAAADRYERIAGYMHAVARVHLVLQGAGSR